MKRILSLLLVTCVLSCARHSADQNLFPKDLKLDYGMSFDKLLIGVESTNSEIVLEKTLVLEDEGITLPIGTRISKAQDNPNTLNYALPEGYKLVGTVSSAGARTIPMAVTAGSLTCTCTRGSGCSPFIASLGQKQVKGCSMNNGCTACSQSTNAIIGGTDVVMADQQVVNFNEEPHFITSKEELSQMASPKVLMQLDEVKKTVREFAKGFQVHDLEQLSKTTGPDDLPLTYTYVHVNFYGTVVLVPVENDITNVSNPFLNQLLVKSPNGRVSAGYSCSCSAGNGCKLTTASLIGKAVWCEAGNCTSCKLNF